MRPAQLNMPTNDKPVKINLPFAEAIRFFARQPDAKRKDSEAEASGSTREDAPASEPSEKRNARRR